MKPIAGTETCQVQHVGYVLSRQIKVVMEGGTEAGAGDAAVIPPGHDAWIVGDEQRRTGFVLGGKKIPHYFRDGAPSPAQVNP
ncbi:MAG TPA: hypothetical protein VFI90_02475 [Rubrobacter sp.]|nr:hypothetical protein [Rubrobacter sp.]